MSNPYIHPNATVIGNVKLGKHSSIWPGAVLRADLNTINIGNYVNIQDNSVLHVDSNQGTQVGDYSVVAHRTVLHSCKIGKACLIAIGSIILEGAQIGDGSVITAGTIVRSYQKIPPGSLVITRQEKLVIYNQSKCLNVITGALQYAELARRIQHNIFGPFSKKELSDFDSRARELARELGLVQN